MFKIVGLDDQVWFHYLNQLPVERRDIHFYPPLLFAYEKALGWKAGLAVTELNSHFICQPILVTGDQIRHAYNFGGPIGTSDCSADVALEHKFQIDKFKGERGIKAEYHTLVPFLADEQLSLTKAAYRKDVVWMDLTQPFELRSTTRHAINKAYMAEANVMNLDDTALFCDIYTETMNRKAAAPHWMLPEVFFRSLKDRLGDDGACLFVTIDGQIEAGCFLVLGQNKIAYYHFAGARFNHPALGLSHFMVNEAARYAKSRGCEKMCLGGGVTDAKDDKLLTFKAGFSKQRAPVYSYVIKEGV